MVHLGSNPEIIREYIERLIEKKKEGDRYWAGRELEDYRRLHRCYWCNETLYDGREVCVWGDVPQHVECFEKNHKQFGPLRI